LRAVDDQELTAVDPTQAAPDRVRAASFMAAADVDAVVATSPANIRYLTGYWCWLAPLFREFMVRPGGSGALVQENYALLPRDGDLCFVVEPYFALNAVGGWVSDVRVAGAGDFVPANGRPSLPPELGATLELLSDDRRPSDPAESLGAAIRERGLDRSRIGVELEGLTPSRIERLRRALPSAALLDCTNMLRLVRAVKTEGQIELLARAAGIAEGAAGAVVAAAGEASTLTELADAFRIALAQDGADIDHFSISFDGLGFATRGDHVLRSSSTHYFDFGCILDGWYSDAGTTIATGEPAAEALADHAAVRDAVAAGAAAIRPGVRASAVQREMQELLAGRGITRSFPHGHGLGIEVRDYPILVPDAGAAIRDDCIEMPADLPLETDMVVNLEACVLTLGSHSVQCEQTFVVTSGGSRQLVPQDREAPLAAGRGGGNLVV
jgi:Xaa-Pro aminopeptidase